MTKTSLSLIAALALTACAAPTIFSPAPIATFYKDGRPAYIASCAANQWQICLEQAGNTCKEGGYTQLEKHQGYGSNNNAMVFVCIGAQAGLATELPGK